MMKTISVFLFVLCAGAATAADSRPSDVHRDLLARWCGKVGVTDVTKAEYVLWTNGKLAGNSGKEADAERDIGAITRLLTALAERMMREIVAEDYGSPLLNMGTWWLLGRARILAMSARVFKRPDMRVMAQRAFDWFLGSNPMCSSYVEGAGQNQWQRPVFGQFFPSTPQIPGGLLHFWGGEYDMPTATLALWTLAELYPNEGKGC